MDQQYDWQEIVERNPKGYLEIQDARAVLHGPVESIEITKTDTVVIKLRWAATMPLEHGVPSGRWTAAPNKPIMFPNFCVPFMIEETPEKGPRVRFGCNIIYLDAVDGLDPSQIDGLQSPSDHPVAQT